MLFDIGYKIFNIFSEEECRNVIEKCQKIGINGDGNVTVNQNIESRSSSIKWINNVDIYNKISPVLEQCNYESKWNFDIHRIEPLQFTRYEISNYYDWHIDGTGKPYSDGNEFDGLVRKMSFTILLTDNFSGGKFQIEEGLPNSKERIHTIEKLNLGDILIFPSNLPHRVTEVTSGTRYSLVGWCCGPPWR